MLNYKESDSKTTNKNLFKWLLVILFVWFLPSSIFWTSLYLYISEDCERKDISTLDTIENKLEEIAHDSTRTRYFQDRFSKLFLSLKGMPINIPNLQRILDGFTGTFPKDMLSIYIFNGNLEIVKTKGASIEFEKFLKLASSSPDDQTITEDHLKEIGQKLPEPYLIIKLVREQKNKAIELGNPDKYSLCFFDYDNKINSQNIGGLLIFVHYNKLNNKDILSETIQKDLKENYGFIDAKDSLLPKILQNSLINDEFIKGYYKQNPTNRFRRHSKLVCIKRLSEYCILVGAKNINHPAWSLFLCIGLIFIISSWFFFKTTYQAFVNQPDKGLNLRSRIIWLFTICYILPIIVGAILASQYLIELKSYLLTNEVQKNYKRLSEIDSGFSRYVTSKLIEYRNINKDLTANVENRDYIIDKLKQMCYDSVIDSAHLISSDSTLLLTSALVSSEVRRHRDKSPKEKQEIYESWFNRGAILTHIHRNYLYNNENAHLYPDDSQKTEAHKAFMKVFSSTSSSAMDYYNQSNNILTQRASSKTNLIVGAIVESHSLGLFKAAKTNIARFTQLEAIKEKILAYLDIIPGPSGEAWYSYVTLTNLDCLERMYLDEIFHDIKIRNSRINRVFSDEDIRAISAHPFATCFPTINEYQIFATTLKQSENDSKTFTHEMTLNGEKCFVSVLRGSYLRQYLLLKIIKEKDINKIYKKQVNTVILIFIIIMVMGLALARIMTKYMIIPITDSINGVKAFGNKNYDYRIKVRSNNELGIISQSFNETASKLEKLDINKEINKYLNYDKELRCGSYFVHTANTNLNLVPSDMFECLPLKAGTYALLSASVSGNDTESAHILTMLKTAFITLMPYYTNNPELMMAKLDKLFEPYKKNQHIINCFIGILDPTNDVILCTNAGQPYPLLFDTKRKASETVNLPSTSLGLGSKSDTSYGKHEISLRYKIMVLYTHGAIDTTNNNGEELGKDNLVKIVNKNLNSDGVNYSEAILKEINDYSVNLPWKEDITIITIRNRF